MSEKNRDDKNRWRNVTIAFRMSPEENEELNNRVKLSGFRTKQDYIIQSVLHQKVVVTGNPLMLVQFRQNLQKIELELERIEKASDMDGELLTPIRSMLEILEGFKEQPRTLADMKQLTVPNDYIRWRGEQYRCWQIWSYVDGLHTEGISAAIQKSGTIWRIT